MPEENRLQVDGDLSFPGGMRSDLDPLRINAGTYFSSINAINRGGAVTSRPGYTWKFNLPDGRFQGAHFLRSYQGEESVFFAIEGDVYRSPYPFVNYTKVADALLNPASDFVMFCTTEQSVIRNADESLSVIAPRRLLLVQDGTSPALYWDGATMKRAPVYTVGGVVVDDISVPNGTSMVWSGDRLWVANGPSLFASDINNPLLFEEATYLSNQSQSFRLFEDITAMAEYTSNTGSQLLVFTKSTVSAFQSSIRKRADWSTVNNFQQVILTGIGCVAPRSVVSQLGSLWWMTRYGMTELNAALSVYRDSTLRYPDIAMAVSKAFLARDLSTIACGAHENFLLVSTPSGSIDNVHTWVMDKAETVRTDSSTSESPVWSSIWTGTAPAQWLTVDAGGATSMLQFSRLSDGRYSCWETFTDKRTDEGAPITWGFETRAYLFKQFGKGPAGLSYQDTIDPKRFKYAEFFLDRIEGDLDVMAHYVGATKGTPLRILTKRISAGNENLDAVTEYDADGPAIPFLTSQTRLIRTQEDGSSFLSGESVESERPDEVDIGFRLSFIASGAGSVRAVRLFAQTATQRRSGACEDDETNPVFVSNDGASGELPGDLVTAPREPTYDASASETVSYGPQTYTSTRAASSTISQVDAQKKATAEAHVGAMLWLMSHTPPFHTP